eukprot:TRINITY_DN64019_c0_g1_i1.p1 TRINITY_DN64019_c0_g1~~TRINITY_DN64019_c0_g1_i1.p1  ORF type:complete len:496 (+),score=98.24 TRINITY_DN64019_c0_g1_i1:91-1488(+)
MPGRGCMVRKAQKRAAERHRPNFDEEPLRKFPRLPVPTSIAGIARETATYVDPPEFGSLVGEEYNKASRLCRAIFNCVSNDADGTSVSVIATDPVVNMLKRDPVFNNQRLVDIIKRHTDIFFVDEDESAPSHEWKVIVLLQGEDNLPFVDETEDIPTAEAMDPSTAEVEAEAEAEAALLPARILLPESDFDRFQALRIDIIHALHARGNFGLMNDIGQIQAIIDNRKAITGKPSLLELIRLFPGNIRTEDRGRGHFMLELLSADVDDTSAIDDYIAGKREKRSDPNVGGARNEIMADARILPAGVVKGGKTSSSPAASKANGRAAGDWQQMMASMKAKGTGKNAMGMMGKGMPMGMMGKGAMMGMMPMVNMDGCSNGTTGRGAGRGLGRGCGSLMGKGAWSGVDSSNWGPAEWESYAWNAFLAGWQACMMSACGFGAEGGIWGQDDDTQSLSHGRPRPGQQSGKK